MNTPPDSASNDPGTTSGHGASFDDPPAAPRWVKVSAIVVGILVVLVVIVKIIGGGHGRGGHSGAGVPTSVSVTAVQLRPAASE